jgi:hypothetical protein
MTTGSDQESVDHRAPPSGVRVADDEPVLIANAARLDRFLHQVCFDFVPIINKLAHQRLPMA